MANESALAPFWEFMREHGLTVPETYVTVTFVGHEAVVKAPEDLVADDDEG
jgi:hypothetical protein